MAYTPTVWQNREVEKPRTFISKLNQDGTITLTPAEGRVLSPGTPIVAVTMNKIETGIKEAHDLANQAFQSANDGKNAVASAITAKGVSASPADTFGTLATKIGQITTGVRSARGSATPIGGTATVRSLSFRPAVVIIKKYDSSNDTSGFVVYADKTVTGGTTHGISVRVDATTVIQSGMTIYNDGFAVSGLTGTAWEWAAYAG